MHFLVTGGKCCLYFPVFSTLSSACSQIVSIYVIYRSAGVLIFDKSILCWILSKKS